ncbi:unnamed protein product [Bemisia tabaci]|uniref:Uncharacterized protein n=1 Tax=Bemisia tabaci TaxID=7038 RepID=A0A9P0A606_BEMTA|nr:unnamed protein product [Bemisia tabaci]
MSQTSAKNVEESCQFQETDLMETEILVPDRNADNDKLAHKNDPKIECPTPIITSKSDVSILENNPESAKKRKPTSPLQTPLSPQKKNNTQNLSSKTKKNVPIVDSLSESSDDDLESKHWDLKSAIKKAVEKHPFSMDYEEILVLLEETKGKRKPSPIIRKYTSDYEGILKVLSSAHNCPVTPDLKGRLRPATGGQFRSTFIRPENDIK